MAVPAQYPGKRCFAANITRQDLVDSSLRGVSIDTALKTVGLLVEIHNVYKKMKPKPTIKCFVQWFTNIFGVTAQEYGYSINDFYKKVSRICAHRTKLHSNRKEDELQQYENQCIFSILVHKKCTNTTVPVGLPSTTFNINEDDVPVVTLSMNRQSVNATSESTPAEISSTLPQCRKRKAPEWFHESSYSEQKTRKPKSQIVLGRSTMQRWNRLREEAGCRNNNDFVPVLMKGYEACLSGKHSVSAEIYWELQKLKQMHQHTRNYLESLNKMRISGELCDFIIHTGDNQTIMAHSVIMAAVSPVLKSHIQSNPTDGKPVTFYDINIYFSTWDKIINYVYSGEAIDPMERDVQYAVDRLQMDIPLQSINRESIESTCSSAENSGFNIAYRPLVASTGNDLPGEMSCQEQLSHEEDQKPDVSNKYILLSMENGSHRDTIKQEPSSPEQHSFTISKTCENATQFYSDYNDAASSCNEVTFREQSSHEGVFVKEETVEENCNELPSPPIPGGKISDTVDRNGNPNKGALGYGLKRDKQQSETNDSYIENVKTKHLYDKSDQTEIPLLDRGANVKLVTKNSGANGTSVTNNSSNIKVLTEISETSGISVMDSSTNVKSLAEISETSGISVKDSSTHVKALTAISETISISVMDSSTKVKALAEVSETSGISVMGSSTNVKALAEISETSGISVMDSSTHVKALTEISETRGISVMNSSTNKKALAEISETNVIQSNPVIT